MPPGGPTDDTKKLREAVDDAKRAQEAIDSESALQNLEKQLEILKQIADNDLDRLNSLSQIARAEQDAARALENRLMMEQELEAARAAGDTAAADRLEFELMAETATAETRERLREVNEEHKDMLEILKELNIERDGEVIKVDELSRAIERQSKTIDKAKSNTHSFIAAFKGSRGFFGGLIEDAGRFQQGMLGMSTKMRKLGQDAGKMGKFFFGVGERITGSIGTLSTGMGMLLFALIGVFLKIGKLALEIDNLSKGFAKATGFGDKFQSTIKEVGDETLLSGVGFQGAADALGSLSGNFSGFNPNAQAANKHLAKTVGLLGQIGVSGDSAAKAMDIMNRAMGVSARVAADMTAQLAMLGKEVGITAQKMVQEFAEANKRLSMYGRDNIKVFKELMGVVKATGLEMGVLTKVAEQFDTFETAAESAAKLNAHLGTNIDMIGAMNMSSSERVLLVRNQVKAQVGNMDSLDKFQKQMVANAMGLSSVEEAQRLLNMSMSEFNSVTNGMQEQADVQAELAKAAAEVIPVMQRLGLIFLKFLTMMQPIFDFFFNLIDLIGKLYDGIVDLSGGAQNAGAIMKGIGYVLSALVIGFGLFTAGIPAATAALITFVTLGLSELYSWFTKSGSPKLYMMPQYFAEGLEKITNAVTRAKEAVGSFASGAMEKLWGIFHKPGSPLLYLLPGVMAAGFIAISNAITNTAKALSEMISLMIEFAQIDFDGFIAVRRDGGATSLVMGSEGIISAMSEGRLTVDINMPELKLPEIKINIHVDSAKWEGIIDAKIDDRLGA